MNMKDDYDPTLYADSVAMIHILNDLGKVSKLIPYKGNESLYIWKEKVYIHVGEGNMKTRYGDLKHKNVLVVSDIKKNLISIGELTSDNSCTIRFLLILL